MAATLSDKDRELFPDRNFAHLTTLNPDGSPQTTVLWVDEARWGDLAEPRRWPGQGGQHPMRSPSVSLIAQSARRVHLRHRQRASTT